MINQLNIFGFVWFTGVVENRFDPLEVGRVRVRIFGYHTDDKIQIPSEELFWAQTLLPVTSPSNSNVSETPRLIEGTHVVGFFMDGRLAQQPVILGALPGIPQSASDPNLGFNDPTGTYPRSDRLDEPDISRLARGAEAENNPVLKSIVDGRVSDIPTAKAPSIVSIAPDNSTADYDYETWSQPNPRFGGETPSDRNYENGSKYGFNQVTESESGHYFEIDDTPGAERICQAHRSGSYTEVLHDGTKVVRVVGSDYEIIVGNKKVFINGSCNVTINGDAKLLVKGNSYEEVQGNKFVHIRGDRHTKIDGNDATEILSNESRQINGNQNIRVSLSKNEVILQNSSLTVGNNQSTNIQGNSLQTVLGNITTTVSGFYACLSQNTMDIGSVQNLNMASAQSVNIRSVNDMKLQIDANMDFDVSGNIDQDIGGSFVVDAGGSIESNAGGDNTITGTKVKLNP